MTRVLLVEDEPLVRIMAEEDLAELGCDVIAAESGDAAIEVIGGGAEFDVLVTDIRMPGSLDGWALAREVRRRFPGIGIVYVSGYAGETHEPLPGSHFVKKPYRLEELHEAVRDCAS